MRSVLVVNTKGGCGKTTISTHLAAAFAVAGHRVLLADADRQHSSLNWLARRPEAHAPIEGADWSRDVGEPGAHVDRLVMDASAAMKLKHVEELVRMADRIVVPVAPSIFDSESTAAFLRRVEELKRVRKNRAVVAVVRNRVRPRTRSAAALERFAAELGLPDLGVIPDRTLYPDLALAGSTVFDQKGRAADRVRQDWNAVLAFVEAD